MSLIYTFAILSITLFLYRRILCKHNLGIATRKDSRKIEIIIIHKEGAADLIQKNCRKYIVAINYGIAYNSIWIFSEGAGMYGAYFSAR